MATASFKRVGHQARHYTGLYNRFAVTQDVVVAELRNSGHDIARRIADDIDAGEVTLKLLGDQQFEKAIMSRFGASAEQARRITAAWDDVGGTIFARRTSNTIFSDVVHEGVHYLDDVGKGVGPRELLRSGILDARAMRYVREMRAFLAERSFQLARSGRTVPAFRSYRNIMNVVLNNYGSNRVRLSSNIRALVTELGGGLR